MSNIKAIDFANNVEQNRQLLIQHCRENGVNASNNDSLNSVVLKNNSINNTTEGKFKIEYIDINGELFAPVQYVNAGESVEPLENYPEFDTDYLEFVEWVFSGNIADVQENIYALPYYRTKYDEDTQQRPAYLVCKFDSTQLSPTFTFQSSSAYTQNAYIDWGDGSTAQQISATMQHTFPQAGTYVLKIWGTKYCIGSNQSYGIFSANGYLGCLLKAYLGENGIIYNNNFASCYGLSYFVCDRNMSAYTGNDFQPTYTFRGTSIRVLIIPSKLAGMGSNFIQGCTRLKYVIVNNVANTNYLAENSMNSIGALKRINIKDNQGINYRALGVLNSLEEINAKGSVSWASTGFSSFLVKKLVIPAKMIALALGNQYSLEELIFEDRTTSISITNISGVPCLKNLNLPDRATGTLALSLINLDTMYVPLNITLNFQGGCVIKSLQLAQGYAKSLSMVNVVVNVSSYLSIAQNIADLTGQSSLTLALPLGDQTYMFDTYVDNTGNKVPAGTTGAVTLLEFITNKNWTVTFS